jgi:alanine dehydrogenase
MIIGVPKEMKKEEYRVGVTPFGVKELKRDGHTVLIEIGAGEGSGFSDDEYLKVDADVVDRKTVFKKSELIVKVKEPLSSEYDLIEEGQVIFTFLHLAPNRELTELLLRRKVTSLGYETLQREGSLPILTPMSEIAGRMAPLMGAYYLQKIYGGAGVLPTGTLGVKPAKVLILGAGVVGSNATRVCVGIGMETFVMNRGTERLQKLDELFMGRIKTLPLTEHNIREEIRDADMVIGSVLIPGGKPPILVTRDMFKTMKKGSVIIDVSVDQGGCVETTRPTFHDDPVYEVDGIIHYTVANMPGAYPRTSTLALTNATLPYINMIARNGIEKVIREDVTLSSSLNTYKGKVVHKALAESMGIKPAKI